MQLWRMSERSLVDGNVSENDQKSDDVTSSSRKRRAEGSYLTSACKTVSDDVRGRPRKMPRTLKKDFVNMVQNVSKFQSSPSAEGSVNSPDLAGRGFEGNWRSNIPYSSIPGTSGDVQATDARVDARLFNIIGTGQGRASFAFPRDSLLSVQRRILPAAAAPTAPLVEDPIVQHLNATSHLSHQQFHQMVSTARPTLHSSFLPERRRNQALESSMMHIEELVELKLLQRHLMNYPSAVLRQRLQHLHDQSHLSPSTQMGNLLTTLPVAGALSLWDNFGIQIEPSTAAPLNSYLPSSLPSGTFLTGSPSVNIHPPSRSVSSGMGQIDPAYASSFLFPRGLQGRVDSPSSQRPQHPQEPPVVKGEDVPVLSRDYGRCEPMELDSDKTALSPFQCLARKQIEFFEAKASDVAAGARGRNNPISLGQVGIRCRHCSKDTPSSRGRAAVYFPTKFDLVYQTAVNMTSTHLCIHCTEVPKEIREELVRLKDQRSTAGGGKTYWAKATAKLGIIETPRGLRFKD